MGISIIDTSRRYRDYQFLFFIVYMVLEADGKWNQNSNQGGEQKGIFHPNNSKIFKITLEGYWKYPVFLGELGYQRDSFNRVNDYIFYDTFNNENCLFSKWAQSNPSPRGSKCQVLSSFWKYLMNIDRLIIN